MDEDELLMSASNADAIDKLKNQLQMPEQGTRKYPQSIVGGALACTMGDKERDEALSKCLVRIKISPNADSYLNYMCCATASASGE